MCRSGKSTTTTTPSSTLHLTSTHTRLAHDIHISGTPTRTHTVYRSVPRHQRPTLLPHLPHPVVAVTCSSNRVNSELAHSPGFWVAITPNPCFDLCEECSLLDGAAPPLSGARRLRGATTFRQFSSYDVFSRVAYSSTTQTSRRSLALWAHPKSVAVVRQRTQNLLLYFEQKHGNNLMGLCPTPGFIIFATRRFACAKIFHTHTHTRRRRRTSAQPMEREPRRTETVDGEAIVMRYESG